MTRIKTSPVWTDLSLPLTAKRPAGRVKAPQSGRRASTNYRTRKQTISPRLIFIAKYNFNHERIKLANDPGVYLMRPQTLYHQLLMFTRSERSSWSLTSGPNGRFEPPRRASGKSLIPQVLVTFPTQRFINILLMSLRISEDIGWASQVSDILLLKGNENTKCIIFVNAWMTTKVTILIVFKVLC